MDGNISEMLKGVLTDPDALKKLMGAAETLMGNGNKSKADEDPPTPHSDSPEQGESREDDRHSERGHRAGNNERIALIAALRPYLSPERRQTANSLIKMLKMLKLADLNKLLKE